MFRNLFGFGKKKIEKEQTKLAEKFGCTYTYFPVSTDIKKVLSAFKNDLDECKKEGTFVPVILVSSDRIEEMIDFEDYDKDKLLNESIVDGGELLAKRLESQKQFFEEYEPEINWDEEYIGEMTGGEIMEPFISFKDDLNKINMPMLLLRIPVKNPWEVFAYIPFGGWNECPAPAEQMAVCKYWHEKHGAWPLAIADDVLEYYIEKPVGSEEAMALASEQYAFCNDLIDQGFESIGFLADSIRKSKYWSFWWD